MSLKRTKTMLVASALALALLALGNGANEARAEPREGPGFDNTPVEIPIVPKSALRNVTSMDLVTLRDLHGIQISPDGSYVAFVLGQAVYDTNSYRSGLFVVGTAKGSRPISLGTAGPPNWDDKNEWLQEDPQWSADSKYLYRRRETAGIWQVWRWSREGGALIQVTHVEHNVTGFHFTQDGTKLVVTVARPSPIDKKQLAEHGILYDGSIDEFEPRPIVDRIAEMRGGESETWIHDLQTSIAHKATAEELETYAQENDPNGKIFSKSFSKQEIEKQSIFGVEISPDRKKVVYLRYVSDPSESAWLSFPLHVKSMDGGPAVSLALWIYYWGQYWWSPDSKEIYYAQSNDVDAGDEAKLMAVPATGGKARQVLKSLGFLRSYSVDRSGRLLACSRENDITPPEVALADLSTGAIRTLIDVNPEFKNLRLSRAQRIDVTNKHGDHFWGHFILPLGYEAGKRYPLIITTYRDYAGFLRGGDPGDEYPIQLLAANGFVVLNFEAGGRVRNNEPDDFDTAFLQSESPIAGMAAAVAKLTEMGVIDGSKVGITGLSHGAVLVDQGISHSSLFQAAINSGGGSLDPFGYYLESEDEHAAASQGFGLASPDGDSRANWQRVSPALNAQHIRAPLLINAADAEYTADMQLVTTLRELRKPVELFIYANERHEKNQPKHRYEIYERNVDWFNFWLRDKKDSEPGKAEQYKRWTKLRSLRDGNSE